MTFLGLTLLILGCLAFFAGLLGLAVARLSEETVRRLGGESLRPYLRHARLSAAVAAPLLLAGFVIGDARRIADPLGALVLATTLLAIIVVLTRPVVNRIRGDGSTVWATISGAMTVLLIAVVIALGFVFSDLLSVLIFFGFVFVFVGALVVVGGVFWIPVALIRRRGRARAGMFTWWSLSLVVIGLVAIGILAPRPPSVPDSMTSAAELDEFLEGLVESDSPPGVSVVVVQGGETVYNNAFGVADGPNGIAASTDTVYHWYSSTKIVTAISIMQLVEQDLIDLDDPVSDYLSFFEPEYPSAASEPVTIANLLNHSSGLQQNMPAVIGWLRTEDEPALVQTEFLKDKLPSYDSLQSEPGSEGVYTNVGYYTLAAVIEQVTGQRYEEYVVEHVLDPLGMVNTRFEYTDAMRANEGVGAHPMADIQTAFIPVMSPPWPFD